MNTSASLLDYIGNIFMYKEILLIFHRVNVYELFELEILNYPPLTIVVFNWVLSWNWLHKSTNILFNYPKLRNYHNPNPRNMELYIKAIWKYLWPQYEVIHDCNIDVWLQYEIIWL